MDRTPSSRRPRRRGRRPAGIAAALLLAGLTAACSSAPALTDSLAPGPDGLTPNGSGVQPGQGTQPGAPGAPGATGAPGTVGGVPGANGPGTVGGVPGANGPGSNGNVAPGGAPRPGATRPGGAPAPQTRTRLWTDAEATLGLTNDKLVMCAHAALTYGKAFNTTADDFNVYWSALNDAGGIHGRKIEISWENDNYSPDTAVQAATTCKSKNPFILLGGIGFDQIPAVRNYVERNRMLYMHHTATVRGTEGQRYSYTALPTVERSGESFAQLAARKHKGAKIGIIGRDSANWEPGTSAFKAAAKRLGLNIVAERKVAVNQGNYTNEILAMRNAGAEVVFAWENALISTQMLTQAEGQGYRPTWLLFPFNLTSQTLADGGMRPKMEGSAMFSAYSYGDTTGSFASYADDIKQFEQQYRKYRPDADIKGVGGDLLFLNWQAQKSLHKLLLLCGKDCNRNKFVDTLHSYRGKPTSSACLLDFRRFGGYRGTDQVNFMETYASPSGKFNWRNTVACVGA